MKGQADDGRRVPPRFCVPPRSQPCRNYEEEKAGKQSVIELLRSLTVAARIEKVASSPAERSGAKSIFFPTPAHFLHHRGRGIGHEREGLSLPCVFGG